MPSGPKGVLSGPKDYFAFSPETFVNIFSCLPGNFALKNGGDFW